MTFSFSWADIEVRFGAGGVLIPAGEIVPIAAAAPVSRPIHDPAVEFDPGENDPESPRALRGRMSAAIVWAPPCGARLSCGGACVLAPGHAVEHECCGAEPGSGAEGCPA